MTNVPENPSISLSNNKNHESSINISDNSQLKVESIPNNNNNNNESSKTSIEIQTNHSIPNQLSDEMTNAMSKLSTHDKRMTNRSNSNRFHQKSNYSYRNSAPMSSHFSSSINPRETDAQLAAFTPPLMSLQLSYPQPETYQRNYRSPRPYIQPQRISLSTKTKSETTASQPEYYVDSFASNFSSKPSSNTNNDKKVKHVTFQEPNNESLKSNSNDSTVSPSSSNGFNYSSSSTWTSSVPMYSNSNQYSPYNYPNYQYSYNEFHPQYSNVMMNQFYATRPRRMNMISTPSTWQTQSYFPYQPTQYVYHPPQSRQLYDPNKPKMPLTSESRDPSKVIRHIAPKNKKRTKETNTDDNSTVSTPEPITHPITILRKPSTDTEVNVLSVENQLVFSPPTEEEEQQQQQQIITLSDIVSKEEQQPTISSDAPFEEQQPINSSNSASEKEEKTISSISNQSESNSTISFPSNELLSILQSANYISSLNEYAQQKKFSLNYEFSSISPSSFTCIISINGRQFPPSPTCLSKNEAQKLACDQALRILYRESCPNEQSSFEFSSKHDYIAHRSISTFQQLNVNDLLLGRKTLACILMTTNQQFEQARVISIATGNSCLDQTNLSYDDNGKALHDSHAEILARRGLIKYLFEQIKQSKDNKSSIFQYNSTNNKYELDETITFHMYISSLPCGNASLNISSNSLRYKQDQTEGTLLASTSTIKFPIKSCSDKICRWNILGIQGGLLINFLTKPIYLQTITIACETTFDRNHVKYSLYERLKEYLQSIPSPFIFHIPDIDCPQMKSLQQERKVAKLQTNAFAWNITQPDRTELLEPRTGKLKNDRSISSLSKQNLFQDFQNIFQDNSLTYQQAKQLNQTYVSIKNLISTAFQTGSSDANISWISKSDQLEQFLIQ